MAKKISEEDRKLFRDAVRGVTPLSSPQKTPRIQPKKFVEIKELEEFESEIFYSDYEPSSVTAEQKLVYMKSGVQPRYMKKLQQGKLAIEAELDLHGYTVEQARKTVQEFISHGFQQGLRVMRIIHGKGRNLPQEKPILKNKVNTWLRQDPRILGFCSASPRDGGTGAIYVLLRKSISGE